MQISYLDHDPEPGFVVRSGDFHQDGEDEHEHHREHAGDQPIKYFRSFLVERNYFRANLIEFIIDYNEEAIAWLTGEESLPSRKLGLF